MFHINDEIHGKINFHKPAVGKIIETKIFQRLKDIKQLGGLYYIYNEACHTRYNHCIGTYYCAIKLMDALEKNSNIRIKDFYRDCVSVAGLLHDVGHGPFSHMWESVTGRHHEKDAEGCIDGIFEDTGIQLFNEDKKKDGIALIKALIIGKFESPSKEKDLQKEIEEDNSKFIFEIISNDKTGIDVDKWDYLKRDMHYLRDYINFKINDFDGVFTDAKVIDGKIHYKSLNEIYNLFDARSKMFIHFYFMPKNIIIEQLIVKCSKLCDLKKGKCEKKLSEITSKEDIENFLKLTDSKLINIFKATEDKEINNYVEYIENTKKIQATPILRDEDEKNGIYRASVKVEHGLTKLNDIKDKLLIIGEVNESNEHQNADYEKDFSYELLNFNKK